jgi:branched-chain amino acid aminotransferase
MLDITVTRTAAPRPRPEADKPLDFGHVFTDHMFMMDYAPDKGWHDARIVPFQNLSLSPAAMVFHYGQEMFEGMKAYAGADGRTYLFRPAMNARRANVSCGRLCMPSIPEEDFIQAVTAAVTMDRDWIPTSPGTSLYIRPFIIATDEYLGVAPSNTYLFMVIMSPSGAYYKSGMEPVGILIEDEYVRAVRGGMGYTKTGGNYAAGLLAQEKAHKEGFSQVLWLDGVERRYIEEVGAMNIFFKIGGKVITPMLSGSILAGVTRDSVLRLCGHWGIPVEERLISLDELVAAQQDGSLEEVFGAGTAAVISPVGRLRYKARDMRVQDGRTGPLSTRLFTTLTDIQWGRAEDPFGWRVRCG